MDNAVNKSTSQVLQAPTSEREIDALAIDVERELCAMIADELPAQFAWNGDLIGDPQQKFKAGFDTACEEIAMRIRLRHEDASNTSEVGQPNTQAK